MYRAILEIVVNSNVGWDSYEDVTYQVVEGQSLEEVRDTAIKLRKEMELDSERTGDFGIALSRREVVSISYEKFEYLGEEK